MARRVDDFAYKFPFGLGKNVFSGRNIAEIYLFCSTTSGACKPCFAFIKDNPLLIQEIQLIRLDTKKVREKVKRGTKFQIHTVPTLMVIYHDGDTSLYQGQQKVLTWLFMRMKTFEEAQQKGPAQPYLPPPPEEVRRTPRPLPPPGDKGLYSSNPPPSLTPPETEIEFFPNQGQEQPDSSPLDINARRKDKDNPMGELVSAARKMEESRQSHLTAGAPPGHQAPPPIKQF
ncbi:hypothetical protein ES703_92336 [subsurface metagenome]